MTEVKRHEMKHEGRDISVRISGASAPVTRKSRGLSNMRQQRCTRGAGDRSAAFPLFAGDDSASRYFLIRDDNAAETSGIYVVLTKKTSLIASGVISVTKGSSVVDDWEAV